MNLHGLGEAADGGAKSTRTVWFTSSATGPNTSALKPGFAALSRYDPGIRFGVMYRPSPFDSVTTSRPVSLDRIVTFAWATMAVDWSRISPRKAPPEIWARAGVPIRGTVRRSLLRRDGESVIMAELVLR